MYLCFGNKDVLEVEMSLVRAMEDNRVPTTLGAVGE
jgi:hypothetical protein